ncbi:unnamed protein product, partial [marine sediment metagenome]
MKKLPSVEYGTAGEELVQLSKYRDKQKHIE